jgi:hypothetical protein
VFQLIEDHEDRVFQHYSNRVSTLEQFMLSNLLKVRSDTIFLRIKDKSLRKDSNQSLQIGGLESTMEKNELESVKA